ncbi:transposable element Tcb2 transposase [Trichonephila clavipes]|nr:transposable element Tcb2 transposase [Trichonephila clavipes]
MESASRTNLHVQSVTRTGHIYRDVILEQNVRLFRGAMGAEFLFMKDNARPHRTNIVDECLQSEDITRMDWPAYSPDLNPIEHVWDMLGRRIAARQPPPTCIPELRRALLDEWCNQDQIDYLILSMPRRYSANQYWVDEDSTTAATVSPARECPFISQQKLDYTNCLQKLHFICELPYENNEKECTLGWILYNSKCYKTVKQQSNYTESLSTCSSEGGRLAVLDDEYVAVSIYYSTVSLDMRPSRIKYSCHTVQTLE